MTASTPRPNHLVETTDAFHAALETLSRESRLGVDTEANSFFVYRERTCLVQVSTASADYIFDPQQVDLTPFGEILADDRIEKIFHAAEFDVLSLRRDFGVVIRNLFDTSIAAKAVGRKKLGLAGLVEEILGLKIAKDEQRSDWGRRPLTREQIDYAFADTRHLISLSDVLKADVHSKGLWEEVSTDCSRMCLKEPKPREFDPESFEKHAGARKMDPVSRRVLRELFIAREERAKELDKPPFRIAGDDVLGELAVRKTVDPERLRGVPGLTPPVMARHGAHLLAAVERGLAMEPLPWVRRPYDGPDAAEEERYERLRTWRRRVAESRGVEVEVIAGNAVLKLLAKQQPRSVEELSAIAELDAYRRSRYGAEMLDALGRR